MSKILSCEFNLDTVCVELHLADFLHLINQSKYNSLLFFAQS